VIWGRAISPQVKTNAIAQKWASQGLPKYRAAIAIKTTAIQHGTPQTRSVDFALRDPVASLFRK
jgi:hypothetical protein